MRYLLPIDAFNGRHLSNLVRNRQLIRQHRIVFRMLDHRARPLFGFLDIARADGVGTKTLGRDLDAISQISEYQIVTYRTHKTTFYRMDGFIPGSPSSIGQEEMS